MGFQGTLLLGVAGVSYLMSVLTTYFRLRHIKGPFPSGFSRWPDRLAILGGAQHHWYEAVTNKYGSLARIGPNYVLTSDPEFFIYASNNPLYKRAEWFFSTVRIEYRRDNLFSTADNALHNTRRKQLAAGYSGKGNLEFEKAIDGRVQDLIQLLRGKYVSTQDKAVAFDMAQKVTFLAADVISEIALGQSFGMLKHDSDVEDYLSSSTAGSKLMGFTHGIGIAWLGQARFIGKFIIPTEEDDAGFGKNIRLCYKLVREREAQERKEPSGRRDMLASFMKHGVAGDDLRSEALVAILAGLQSTSDGLAAVLLQIVTNPRVYAKLQAEIDDFVVDTGMDACEVVPTEGLKSLPYLQAVYREGLRCLPPNCATMPREVPSGGDIVAIDGKQILLPGGTSVGICQLGVQNRKDIFGENTEVFRPERWFEDDEEKLAMMIRANDLGFGSGRFGCLGKEMARIEIQKALFEVVRNFDIALAHPDRPCNIENIATGFVAVTDMWVVLHERNK